MNRIRAFLLSFCLSIGILIPLLACIMLLQSRQISNGQEQVQADATTNGVPIALPSPDDKLTCLAMIQQEDTNYFLLLGLDAVKNRISVLGFPKDTVVLLPQGGTSTLEQEATQAGPGRAAELLSQTLQIEIPHYLLAKSTDLTKASSMLGAVTVNLSGYDISGAKASVGKAPVCMMVPEQVFSLLDEWNLKDTQKSSLFANITGEFLLAAIQSDSTIPTQILRQASSKLLTTLTSQEFRQIDRICKLMNGKESEFSPEILPGTAANDRFELNDDSIALVHKYFTAKSSASSDSVDSSSDESSDSSSSDS